MTTVNLTSNEFWGRKGGGFYDENKPKGCALPWGYVIKQQQWNSTNGGNNNRPVKCTLFNVNKKWFK